MKRVRRVCRAALGVVASCSLLPRRRRLSYSSAKGNALALTTSHQRLPLQSQAKKRSMWVRQIFKDHDTYGAWATLIPTMRENDREKYYNFFRMWPEDFDELLELLIKEFPPVVKKSRRKPICPGERLAITLRKLVSGDSNQSLSYIYRVADQTISKILLETCHGIWKVLEPRVFEKPTEDMWIRNAAEFECMWNLPNCVGAVDNVHIVVKDFPHAGSEFFNYRKQHSLSVMAVADAKQRFTLVDVGAKGSRGDGGIYGASSMAKNLAEAKLQLPPPITVPGGEEMPFYFIGDCAFRRGENFATPFKGAFLESAEMLYNLRLSRARRSVEHAFGILEKRYELMADCIEGSLPLVKVEILACFALHNFHLRDEKTVPPNRRASRPPGFANYVNAEGQYVYGRWRQEKPWEETRCRLRLSSQVAVAKKHDEEAEAAALLDPTGLDLRKKMMLYFIENPVPWQWSTLKLLKCVLLFHQL